MKDTAVVILNWNGKRFLERFLPSVISTSKEADVIVADNASSDDSVSFIESNYPFVRILRLEQNFGFAGGYNRAISLLDKYRYAVLLNSDVEPAPGWLRPLVQCLDKNPDVAVCSPKLLSLNYRTRFEYAGAAGGFIDFLGYPFCRGRILDVEEEDQGQYDTERDVFWVSGAAMCLRVSHFISLGGFAEEFFAHMEEIDFCWRTQLIGGRVVAVPESKVYHLGGGTLSTSSPRKIFYNHRNNLAMLLRCAPCGQRLLVSVVRPFLDMLSAITYLCSGKVTAFGMVFKAYWDFFKWHPRLIRQRREIQRMKIQPSAHIFRGSIILRYFLGLRKFNKMM
ncbi:MAG: glycosyltransferase family 2 protein [Alistipes sp.]|nr:glycosyltransferase family 2 protein [Candidatus Alistipes equi]